MAPSSRFALFVMAAASVWTGCGSTPSSDSEGSGAAEDPDVGLFPLDDAADAALSSEDLVELDPFPRERTLTCDYSGGLTLNLATGVTRAIVGDEQPDDLTCYFARYIALDAPGNLCLLETPATELGAIQLPETCALPNSDAWQPYLLCGVNINGPFQPDCVDTAFIVRVSDTGDLYRVRVREDFRSADRGNGVTFVYEPL